MKPGVIFIVILSLLIWVAAFYFGWLSDIYYFGRNIYNSWSKGNIVTISTNSNVKTITTGQYAYNLLTEINIPPNITTIESKAFKGNMLTKITIGQNVNLIGTPFGNGFDVFYKDNKKNAGIYTRNNQYSQQWTSWFNDFSYTRQSNIDIITEINYISKNSYIIITGYSGSANEVVIPSEIYGEPVIQIGKDAFYGVGITAVTFPQSIISIEESAFAYNRLTRITIPNSVKSIGVDAFAVNPITRVSLGANIALGSDNNNHGILGQATGFNSAYRTANNSRAGTYSRQSASATSWTRTANSAYASNTTTTTQTSTPTSQTTPSNTPRLSPTEQSLQALVGVYKGSYFANQGETGLTLTVYKESNTYKATFDFYNLPGKSNARNGKYSMDVSYNQSTKKYYLKGTKWINQPGNYYFVDLEGSLAGDVFTGKVIGGSTYRVVRSNTPSA